MRLTKRSNIAMRVLMFCAVNPGRRVTKAEVAERCNTSHSHMAQIVMQLAQLGYLETQRGRGGGFGLGRPAGQIVVGDVFRAFESDLPTTACFADADDTCPLKAACRLRPAIMEAAEAFFARLDGLTLDALVCGNDALDALLAPRACAVAA